MGFWDGLKEISKEVGKTALKSSKSLAKDLGNSIKESYEDGSLGDNLIKSIRDINLEKGNYDGVMKAEEILQKRKNNR